MHEGKLWRKETDGCHKGIPAVWATPRLLVQAHDKMGHKGVYRCMPPPARPILVAYTWEGHCLVHPDMP
jgi:hypothetical protein